MESLQLEQMQLALLQNGSVAEQGANYDPINSSDHLEKMWKASLAPGISI